MPELAEVAYYCSRWKPALGKRIDEAVCNTRSRCARDVEGAALQDALIGSRMRSAETHGKQMLFRFSGDVWLGIHLGMTGKLGVDSPPDRHDHLWFRSGSSRYVFNDPRQFGRIRFHVGVDAPEWWRDLPPEVLDQAFTRELLEVHCLRRKGVVAKAFLLLQDCFPGVGNWMADEILWRARIDPRRRVATLSQSERDTLFEALKYVCRGALRHIAPDFTDPPKTWLFSHRWKDGGTCPKTGQPLTRETIATRTTCWSPTWQR